MKTLVVLFILAVAYLFWLDAGCGALGGAMTWSGKVCVEQLAGQ